MITRDGAKMSKSRGNTVSPAEYVERYGADTARTYICFMGPPERDADWADEGVEGVNRFLSRLWRLCEEVEAEAGGRARRRCGRGRRARPARQGPLGDRQGDPRLPARLPVQHRDRRGDGAGQRRLPAQGRPLRGARAGPPRCASPPPPRPRWSSPSRRTSAPRSGSGCRAAASGSSPGPRPTRRCWSARPSPSWSRSTASCATGSRRPPTPPRRSCCALARASEKVEPLPRRQRGRQGDRRAGQAGQPGGSLSRCTGFTLGRLSGTKRACWSGDSQRRRSRSGTACARAC